jgi:hypothetical protein
LPRFALGRQKNYGIPSHCHGKRISSVNHNTAKNLR